MLFYMESNLFQNKYNLEDLISDSKMKFTTTKKDFKLILDEEYNEE